MALSRRYVTSCSRDDVPPYDRVRRPRPGKRWLPATGQAIVEFALLFPILAIILLGMLDGGRLVIAKASQDRATAVVADWAAEHPGDASWQATANQVGLTGCDVTIDDSRPGLVEARSTCQFTPIGLTMWDGLAVSSSESAATRSEPSPAPSPSDSPAPS